MRSYLWSDAARRIQVVLGLVWLLDGGLQFQAFMYSHAFPASLVANASGQADWVHASIVWGAKFANGDLTVWNTLFALVQMLIGLGLLYRPTVKLAIAGSFAWVLIVWWFGEGFGMMLMLMAQPLTGAPGGVLLYALVGLVAWPGRAGGLLGPDGVRRMWAILWLVMAFLWLAGPSSDPNATHDALTSVPSGIGAVTSLQNHLADASAGHGLVIALVLAALSAVIGIAVARDWHGREFLVVSMLLNLVYWIVPQGLGGMFAGGATDPNAGPLFILLAWAVWPYLEAPAAAAAGASTPIDADPGQARRRTVRAGFVPSARPASNP